MIDPVPTSHDRTQLSWRRLIYPVLLVIVLLAGAYLRFSGILWGEYTFMHPDERFLLWVGRDIAPVQSLSEYWDTANSSLNPHNRGHGFYVYGTLPMFLMRYVVEWVYGYSEFDVNTNIGRPLSALADLGTVILVFLIGARLYRWRVGVLAAAFYACAVLPIQQSHFFTMDTFITFFAMLVVYFAVQVMLTAWPANSIQQVSATPAPAPGDVGPIPGQDEATSGALTDDLQLTSSTRQLPDAERQSPSRFMNGLLRLTSQPLFLLSLGFGAALGMAVASKINAAPLALLLPAAMLVNLSGLPVAEQRRWLKEALFYLFLAAFTSLLVFRIFQPYAFSGPGFFGVLPNPEWMANLQSLRDQATGDVDFPPAIQWARRPVWFAWYNQVMWGMGLPLGLLTWAGFLYAGWRIFKGEWRRHALLWGWTGLYFLWQAIPFNPTMRYQLPIYPTLTIFAAWIVYYWWDRSAQRFRDGQAQSVEATSVPLQQSDRKLHSWLAVVIGAGVLLTTAAYAYAFVTNIYGQPFTRVAASRWIYQNIPGAINLRIQTEAGLYNQPHSLRNDFIIRPGLPLETSFIARQSGQLVEVHLGRVIDQDSTSGERTLNLKINTQPVHTEPLAEASLTANLAAGAGGRGQGYTLSLDQSIVLAAGQTYYLELALEGEHGAVIAEGAAIAVEGAWDDGLPLRLDNYDGYGGIYQGHAFDMYETDNPNKLERYLAILDEVDYITISSSRQWGSLPRIPERFPMNTAYFRHLIGCPADQPVEWCYQVGQPGDLQGELGFELIQVFQSKPTLGLFSLNTQFAEEAFTVYDHPKVFIFKKQDSYDPARVRALLGAIDLTKVVHITPGKAGNWPWDRIFPVDLVAIERAAQAGPLSSSQDMMLPPDRLAEQYARGTWSELFNTLALHNRYPIFGLALWYLAVAFLGLVAYPWVRLALPGLPDRGYPLARIAGLLLLSYLVWLAGSFRIPFERVTITAVMALMVGLSGLLVYRQRVQLRQEWCSGRRYFLLIEGLFLAFFVFSLLIRLGNPDLWHPWKGGEKPMDFSYFNAVLKSTTFPPYDPWFSGGYINYYYYGFVLVGVLTKWLGIVPSVAYNLFLPTIFALIAMGAFSIGWNLVAWRKEGGILLGMTGKELTGDAPAGPFTSTSTTLQEQLRASFRVSRATLQQLIVGLSAAVGMAVLGNLGTLRMIFHGYQRLAAPEGATEGAGVVTRLVWSIQGLFRALQGTPLPYSLADWYWIPSRAIPAPGEPEPITEFPFFTVLYGDPHAHLFVLPLTLLALAWALSLVLGRTREGGPEGLIRRSPLQIGIVFLLGGLAIGALRPTNTWDLPTYLALGVIAVVYSIWRNYQPGVNSILSGIPVSARRLLAALAGVILLAGFTFLLYQPYAQWYVQGYTEVELWQGNRTPIWSYFTHWGLFLFVIVSWMAWETRAWMASTPLSSLRKLRPYQGLIWLAGLMLLAWVGVLTYLGVTIAWLVVLLAAWAGVLILRPGLAESKRAVLFLVGTGLALTLMVEIIVLRGDVGRMNTVFKFYLQVWTLFAVSAAAAFGWLLAAINEWKPSWRSGWQLALVFLVFSAALYPLLAGTAKIKDRMAPHAPNTLDGMAYINYAVYHDLNTVLDLSEDYRAIRWMQENVSGSPVIVEANMVEYHWGTRYTIYTGLPNVVGWNWHQRQQRALAPANTVQQRVSEVNEFYLDSDINATQAFLEQYGVRYIIVGQLERAYYPGAGLDKFEQFDGFLWQSVYRDGETVIYEVINE